MSEKIETLMIENIKDSMWECFQKFGQKSNIPQLKEYCYALIQATTQKTAGQRENKPNDFDWRHLDMLLMSIAIEATALVLSGDLDEIEKKKEIEGAQLKKEYTDHKQCPNCTYFVGCEKAIWTGACDEYEEVKNDK